MGSTQRERGENIRTHIAKERRKNITTHTTRRKTYIHTGTYITKRQIEVKQICIHSSRKVTHTHSKERNNEKKNEREIFSESKLTFTNVGYVTSK